MSEYDAGYILDQIHPVRDQPSVYPDFLLSFFEYLYGYIPVDTFDLVRSSPYVGGFLPQGDQPCIFSGTKRRTVAENVDRFYEVRFPLAVLSDQVDYRSIYIEGCFADVTKILV